MNSSPSQRIVLTNRHRVRLQRFIAVAVFLIAAAAALGASPERAAQATVLAAGAAGAAGAIAIARIANTRVIVDRDGLVLKGPLRAQHVAWTDVERFVVEEPLRRGDPPRPVLELTDGSNLALAGLDPPFALLRGNDGAQARAAV